jgi:endoglucanase
MGLPDCRRRRLLQSLVAASTAASTRAGALLAGGLMSNSARADLIANVWEDFRVRFVTRDGRVLDDDGSTHSEGLGTGLLAAAAAGDGDSFSRIWDFARQLRRDDGLFSWRVQDGGRVIDTNNATDGDLYIAWALARAAHSLSTPAYLSEARRLARAIRSHCVRESRHGPVLVPGRFGFDRSGYVVANPSYWVFPAFAALGQLDPHPLWPALTTSSLALLAKARFGEKGLTADWIEIDHGVRPWRERPARFGYEAIRVPLFLYWGGYLDHPQLVAFTRHAAAPAFRAWVALDSDDRSRERAPPGFEAIARLARALPTVSRAQIPAVNSNYYPSSLTVLAAVANDDMVSQVLGQQSAGAGPRPVSNRPD